MGMMEQRLKRLETERERKNAYLTVGNDDNFITALVGADNAERYHNMRGYDFMKALSDTGARDWSGSDGLF